MDFRTIRQQFQIESESFDKNTITWRLETRERVKKIYCRALALTTHFLKENHMESFSGIFFGVWKALSY